MGDTVGSVVGIGVNVATGNWAGAAMGGAKLLGGMVGGGDSKSSGGSSSSASSSGRSRSTVTGGVDDLSTITRNRRNINTAQSQLAQKNSTTSSMPVGLKDALSSTSYKSNAFNLQSFYGAWGERLDAFLMNDKDKA